MNIDAELGVPGLMDDIDNTGNDAAVRVPDYLTDFQSTNDWVSGTLPAAPATRVDVSRGTR